MKKKKNLWKLATLSSSIVAVGAILASFKLAEQVVSQGKTINNLEGEIENLKDLNRGQVKIIERQAFTIGKMHNQLHRE